MHNNKLRAVSALAVMILIASCGQNPEAEAVEETSQTDLSEFDSPTLPPTSDGESVPVAFRSESVLPSYEFI